MIERSILNSLRFDQNKLASIPENLSGDGKLHDNQGKFPSKTRKIVVRKNNESSDIKPKIHKTVFARMKNQEYEPENVRNLDSKYEMVE